MLLVYISQGCVNDTEPYSAIILVNMVGMPVGIIEISQASSRCVLIYNLRSVASSHVVQVI